MKDHCKAQRRVGPGNAPGAWEIAFASESQITVVVPLGVAAPADRPSVIRVVVPEGYVLARFDRCLDGDAGSPRDEQPRIEAVRPEPSAAPAGGEMIAALPRCEGPTPVAFGVMQLRRLSDPVEDRWREILISASAGDGAPESLCVP
jgi:hypothetical protein